MEIITITIVITLRVIANPIGNVFQKRLTIRGRHPLFINFFTYLSLGIFCLIPSSLIDWRIYPVEFWYNVSIAGLLGALGNGFLVKALEKGELSVLGPINSYKSIVGIIFGIFLLGEMPNAWGLLGIALIVLGSYFVLDSKEEPFSIRLFFKAEIQYRILAMIFTAIEAVFIKRIILLSSTEVAFICWCIFGAIFSFFLLPIYKIKTIPAFSILSSKDYVFFTLLIISIGLMQITTNYAFKLMDVGYALSLFQLSVIVSILLGYKIFQESAIHRKLFGALIMIIGSVLIILLK
ncbi:MAG: DMT family transporter [Bacteroidota bacterium]